MLGSGIFIPDPDFLSNSDPGSKNKNKNKREEGKIVALGIFRKIENNFIFEQVVQKKNLSQWKNKYSHFYQKIVTYGNSQNFGIGIQDPQHCSLRQIL